jgi:2-polyprenyl-3-methyl-5-hydroxy-6-metoxy-1,4-benzoquinol methylase
MENESQFELRDLPCAVCGSESRTHVGWRGGAAHHAGKGVRIEIVRCNSCTHFYPHPMPYPRKDIASLYTDPDDYFSAHDIEQKKKIGREVTRILEEKVQHRGSLLDIGCGRGELLWAARQAGWEVEGIDPSAVYLDWGRTHLGVEGRLGTIEEMGFAENRFDAVIMGGVIEHLYDPFRTLSEVHRVLKPGGIFYFDSPNENGLYMRMGNRYMRAQGRDWVVNLAPTFAPYHVQGFNPTSLRRLLQRVGLEVMDFGIGGITSPPTGEKSLRKRLEYRAAQLVNWIGNQTGAGIYMYVWTRKPQ